AAYTTDNTQNFIKNDDSTDATPFDYGSGHINPAAATDPGLIYDFNTNDIINLLCSYHASPAQLKNLSKTPFYCQNPPTSSYNFNYPSIGVSNMTGNLSVYRTVTYIGEAAAVGTPAKDPTIATSLESVAASIDVVVKCDWIIRVSKIKALERAIRCCDPVNTRSEVMAYRSRYGLKWVKHARSERLDISCATE
nr:subtilisin-like protease SBT5.3 [Tanacetum cinerariifolium]